MFFLHGQHYPANPNQIIQTQILTVRELLTQGDLGMVVPHSYHQFTWDAAQVSRFMGDVCTCVAESIRDQSAMHFFGPLTLVPAIMPEFMIHRPDPYVMPRHIYAVIDGQQRLSSLALLASRLYWHLHALRPITFHSELEELSWLFDRSMNLLLNICSFKLRDDHAIRKPGLIHGRFDDWGEKNGNSGEYRSDVGFYLNQFFIRRLADEDSLPDRSSLPISSHLDVIDDWLAIVMQAHYRRTDLYPNAWRIRSGMYYLDWRHFNLSTVAAAVGTNVTDDTLIESKVCAFIQLWVFVHTFLHRCCFVVITPTTERAMHDLLVARERELDGRKRT
jgi:hypothetical protein